MKKLIISINALIFLLSLSCANMAGIPYGDQTNPAYIKLGNNVTSINITQTFSLNNTQIKYLTTNVSNNNMTALNTTLSFDLDANTTYQLESNFCITTDLDGLEIRPTFFYPLSFNVTGLILYVQSGIGFTQNMIYNGNLNDNTPIASYTDTTVLWHVPYMHVFIKTGNVSGNITYAFSAGTNYAGNITMNSGSSLILTKIN